MSEINFGTRHVIDNLIIYEAAAAAQQIPYITVNCFNKLKAESVSVSELELKWMGLVADKATESV